MPEPAEDKTEAAVDAKADDIEKGSSPEVEPEERKEQPPEVDENKTHDVPENVKPTGESEATLDTGADIEKRSNPEVDPEKQPPEGDKKISKVRFNAEGTSPHSAENTAENTAESTNGVERPFQRETGTKDPTLKRTPSNSRSPSLVLRRLPVDSLLKPAFVECASICSDENGQDEKDEGTVGEKTDLLHILCLRPGYTLRTQLLLSFGTINAVTVAFVVAICIVVSGLAGKYVKDTYETSYVEYMTENAGLSARYLAESLDQRLMLFNVADIMYEATQDRFAGYPNESDDKVPFFDVDSQTRKYPISAQPLPLDWQIEQYMNEKGNFEEHFQNRDYYNNRTVSTASGMFFMQGACDPSITDIYADTFWQNCTDANNDISTGGVVAPSLMTEHIHRKAKDLTPLLKALFESREEIRDLGVYFANSGAGASVSFPYYPLPGSSTYVSVGCDWMNETNPRDASRMIGTQEMIGMCHPAGEEVSTRLYNPLERGWCRDQALSPDRLLFATGRNAWENDEWLFSVGRAVYDRLTKDFVACIFVGISLGAIDEELAESRIVPGSELSVVLWDKNGTIISSSGLDASQNRSLTIYEASLGLTKESYEELYNLVDFGSQWDPTEVRSKYGNFTSEDDNYFVASYPMPPIPDNYDDTYEPLLFIIVSTSTDTVSSIVDVMNYTVDKKVRDVNKFSIIAGAIGLAVATLIIFMMSSMLTLPLKSMNKVAQEIVDNFGVPSEEKRIEGSEQKISKEASCTPRTELSEVVKEFNKMVTSFSGTTMAKSERAKHHEVHNIFNLRNEFSELYASRDNDDFKYSIEPPAERIRNGYVHAGRNLAVSEATTTTAPTTSGNAATKSKKCSPLFLWTLVLIVTPLLVVNITISAVVISMVSVALTESVDEVQDIFILNQSTALLVHSRLRADYVSGLTAKSTSDLFVLARYSNWLLFGGLERSNAFTEVISGAEACKLFDDVTECPYFQETNVCDCAWGDNQSQTCQHYPGGSRPLQKKFFACESHGTKADGDRNTTGYPDVSYSTETTSWWDNQTGVPGGGESSAASGYNSTYDRLRSISAHPLFEVLYNYGVDKNSTIATYVGFEADGLFVGYNGCFNGFHANLASWSSTKENGAAEMRPELCPLGKYGYDPRYVAESCPTESYFLAFCTDSLLFSCSCRGWYDTGRKLAMQKDTFLHITAPYQFAQGLDQISVAQSATSPLVDPKTGKHIGQVLMDFHPDAIYEALDQHTPLSPVGFPILVAAQEDNDSDTVVGPGYSRSNSSISIAAVLLDKEMLCTDSECAINQAAIEKIVESMKAGEAKNETFIRKTSIGDDEKIHLAYAPVKVKSFHPVDSSDFSRGVNVSEYLIYSLGLAETETGMLEPFDKIEDDAQKRMNVAIGILSVLIAAATIVVIYISHRVATSITEPMLYLLELTRSINR
jgi:HAMP domain-containing protein